MKPIARARHLLILIPARIQLLLETGEPLPAAQFTEVYSAIYPTQMNLKSPWVQVQGQLGIEDASDLPNKIQLQVVSMDSRNESIYNRFNLNLSVKNDGTFSGRKKFKNNLRPETLQMFLVRPNGDSIPAGTEVALCLEVVKKKGDLPATGLVRWVLSGNDATHTVSAMDNSFDSVFAFLTMGATFQHRFTAADNGKTFQYYCRTHQGCCAMQGSVQVGANAPTPPPGY
ncbi:MAG: hypothetical protein P8Y44_07665 [Acidobacteriota bacterium]